MIGTSHLGCSLLISKIKDKNWNETRVFLLRFSSPPTALAVTRFKCRPVRQSTYNSQNSWFYVIFAHCARMCMCANSAWNAELNSDHALNACTCPRSIRFITLRNIEHRRVSSLRQFCLRFVWSLVIRISSEYESLFTSLLLSCFGFVEMSRWSNRIMSYG